MTTRYDAIVIGTGQSGPALARRLAQAGQRVAILERKHFGGTCVNTGCIPTKTLVASARAAWVARHAAELGVDVPGPVRVDMRRVHARMSEISGRSRRGVERSLVGQENLTVYRGHGRLSGARRVTVNGETLVAERIFLNVGARATVPDWPGLAEIPYLDNASILAIDSLPQHLIVVGGSYIGLEFAQIFRRFGSEVTIVHRGSRLVEREDEDVSAAILEVLEKEGIAVRLRAECLGLERRGDRVVATVACGEGAPQVLGSHVLLAVGRTPNTHDLGLETAGVAVDARGYIEVDDELRTSTPGIWALGDCNGRGGFTHTSWNDYEIVAANLLEATAGSVRRKVTDRIPCYALFVDPPLGRVGMNEAQARAAGRPVLAGKYYMEDVARAYERGETAGLMKVLVDAETERILGATILGIEGDEVVHTLLAAMYAGAPYTLLLRAMHVHPTVSEFLPSLLQGLEPLA